MRLIICADCGSVIEYTIGRPPVRCLGCREVNKKVRWTAYGEQWVTDNQELRKSQRKQVRDSNVQQIRDIKTKSGCVDCGYDLHPAALEFDHVRGTKLFEISKAAQKAWRLIESEMEKCDIVCSNCHAIRTFERRETPEEVRCPI